MSSNWFRNSFVYLLILVAVVALFFSIFQTPEEGIGIPLTLNGFGDGFDKLP